MITTLGDLTVRHGFEVLEHLEAEAEVPVLKGLQAQGDLFIIPVSREGAEVYRAGNSGGKVPAQGIAVIEAANGGHEHRMFAGAPGSAFWTGLGAGQDIGVLECIEPAYLIHPEHGATGVAPGSYLLRRQREQAEEERLVAD